jgi:hypothetical protein
LFGEQYQKAPQLCQKDEGAEVAKDLTVSQNPGMSLSLQIVSGIYLSFKLSYNGIAFSLNVVGNIKGQGHHS